jgi:hypothetical protein
MPGYTINIEVASTPKEVFNVINDVPKWWIREAGGITTEFEGESSNLNDVFILRHGDKHYSKHQLIELIPLKKVVWLVTESKLTWIKENKEEWTGTKMVFEVFRLAKKTKVIFTHEGLVPELDCYEHCVHFWDRVIKGWLFDFMHSGKI